MTGSMPMTSITGRIALPIAAIFALLLTAFTALPAFAQNQTQEVSPELLALARKYVDLTDKSGVYETTVVQVGIQTRQTLVSQNPANVAQIEQAIGTVIATYKGKKDDLFNQFARLYALTFTQEELQQIVDFYSTPTGQKLAKANVDLNPSINRVVSIYTDNLQREFFGKVRAELKAKGIDL
jgi:hypothetical protein